MDHVTVKILDRDYRLSCAPAERDTLLAAVAHVDASMRTIRDQGKIAGTERIAVFAALNIAGELLAQASGARPAIAPTADASDATRRGSVADPEILRRMQSINEVLDTALGNQERLF